MLITLLTDFGHRDVYVGVMKGVISGIAPDARVVDLCHAVPPQGLVSAAYQLGAAYPHFPAGTVHVVVVDPGVGTGRAIVAIRAAGSVFLAPDNGVLAAVLSGDAVEEAVAVENAALFRASVSATFHGRDVFAPVAARLATGTPLGELGPARDPDGLVRGEPGRLLGGPTPSADGRGLDGAAVLDVDRFGNVITNIDGRLGARIGSITVGELRVVRFARTYGEVEAGAALALVGSTGRVEISVRDGSAAAVAGGVAPGDPIRVELGEGTP